jgi:hypothetical protein
MGRSNGFATAGDHLVERAALGKVGIEFATEFTLSAGTCVEAMNDGRINVFHEKRLLGRDEKQSRPACEAGSQYLPLNDCHLLFDAFVLHGTGPVQVFRGGSNFAVDLRARSMERTPAVACSPIARSSQLSQTSCDGSCHFWHDKGHFQFELKTDSTIIILEIL